MYQLSVALPPLPPPQAASTLMDSAAAAQPATTLRIGRTAIPPPTTSRSGARDARHRDGTNVTASSKERNSSTPSLAEPDRLVSRKWSAGIARKARDEDRRPLRQRHCVDAEVGQH